jgi:hypothetical protein
VIAAQERAAEDEPICGELDGAAARERGDVRGDEARHEKRLPAAAPVHARRRSA